jgi:hypothetical protein
MLVAYTTSLALPRRAIFRTTAACRTPGGRLRETHDTGYSRGSGSRPAVVTTSTV